MTLDSTVQSPSRPDRSGKAANIWHVYLLECAASGGARYTSGRRPVRLLASRACARKDAALRLEHAVKSRPRAEKILFLQEGALAPC